MKDRFVTADTSKNSTGNIVPEMFEISADQASYFTKQVFIDTATLKMHQEAKRACERVGVNPQDLIEKPYT